MKISKIENDVQDKNCEAWKKLCEYVDELAASGGKEFSPLEALGPELFAQIHTLPESIAKLKKVKKMWLYGSKLKRIPPEIGEMTELKYFDPYTSYELHWFPYEITNCKKLVDSRVSTRALFGNVTNRMGFPYLGENPVRYSGDIVHCSLCRKEMSYDETYQLWITLRVGTDDLPMLVNSCSEECTSQLLKPPAYFVSRPHKGGSRLQQPNLDEDDVWDMKAEARKEPKVEGGPKLFSVVRKIWEKDE
ncbi:hypothetical protein [Aliikangiella coralliicola]|uniref:hypothetical protein n=1 Tax=Aliikangiella coralliicola TaxID=2592383 RepID=UPI001AEF627C|nr:hypothetical protein [Aliikangiella coralliicola]